MGGEARLAKVLFLAAKVTTRDVVAAAPCHGCKPIVLESFRRKIMPGSFSPRLLGYHCKRLAYRMRDGGQKIRTRSPLFFGAIRGRLEDLTLSDFLGLLEWRSDPC